MPKARMGDERCLKALDRGEKQKSANLAWVVVGQDRKEATGEGKP